MKIKIVYQNEIHLLKQQVPSFEAIQEHVKKIFPSVGSDFTLAYTDSENDQITLSCQDDLQVLIDEGVQSLKITVQPKTQQQPQQQKMVHNRYVCDGCQAHPIIGTRFKCLDCPNYDLCETCQAKNIHNDHKFFKISNFEELANYENEYKQKEKEQQQAPRFPHGFHPQGPHGVPPQGLFGAPPQGLFGAPPQGLFGAPPQGPHGWGRGGHCGPHGGPHQHFFKQMKELFQDPQFKELKNNVCQIAKEAITIIKQQMEQLQNKQNQQQETQQETTENKQEETPTSEVVEPEIPQKEQEVVQEPQVDEKQVEFEQKVKGLAVVLNCQESAAKEYVEMFRDLTLDEIVDIIINGN